MIDYIVSILREYPTLALFLTIGLGFLIGKIRIGTFSIGNVPSVLLVGLLVGQLDIPMSGPREKLLSDAARRHSHLHRIARSCARHSWKHTPRNRLHRDLCSGKPHARDLATGDCACGIKGIKS